MKVKACVPALVGAAAIVGAVLRGLNLIRGYEYDTGLPIRGDLAEMLLIGLTAAAFIVLFLIGLQFRENKGADFEVVFQSSGTGFKMISVIAGLVMILAGVGGLYVTMTQNSSAPMSANLPLFPLWLLAILSGGCFIGIAAALARNQITSSVASLTIIPMFWACFDLIMTFKDNGTSPFVGLYGFELLAATMLTYSFYVLAGFLYSKSSPSRFVFSSGMAAMLCITCVGGLAIAYFGGAPIAVDITLSVVLRYACFLASGVWLFALLYMLCRNLKNN